MTTKSTTLFALLIGLMALAAGAASHPSPSSELLLPYFEVDVSEGGTRTTSFAVVNAHRRPVTIEISLHTNWGIDVLSARFRIQKDAVREVDLRDWLVDGKVLGSWSLNGRAFIDPRDLNAAESANLRKALSGQQAWNQYFSSEDKADHVTGFVRIEVLGQNAPQALFGQYLLLDEAENLAAGDHLIDIDPTGGRPEVCDSHGLPLSTGGLDQAEIVVWSETTAFKPSANGHPSGSLPQGSAYAGTDELPLNLPRPLTVGTVSELGLDGSSGWLKLETEQPSFVFLRFSDGTRSSALRASCLPGSRELLLPHFDVATDGAGATTRFTLVNPAGERTDAEVSLHTNWGIEVLTSTVPVPARGLTTIDLRDWIAAGDVAGEWSLYGEAVEDEREGALSPDEQDALQAALSGKQSWNGLYYSTETDLGHATGSVRIAAQGGLLGHYAVLAPHNDRAGSDVLVDPGGACRRQGLRFFLQDESFEDTSVVIWSARELDPSPDPDGGQRAAAITAYADNAAVDERFRKGYLPLQVFRASELGWVEPGARSGWLDVIAPEDTFISVLYLGDPDQQKYGALLQASCLAAKGAGVQIEKLTGYFDADTESEAVEVNVGDPPPKWRYFVTNVGDANLRDVQVTDDREGHVCTVDLLQPNEIAGVAEETPGESLCQKESTRTVSAEELYKNVGKVKACPKPGGCLSEKDYLVEKDPSHYRAVDESITAKGALDVEVRVNRQVALEAPGPEISICKTARWRYRLTNLSDVSLVQIDMRDDQGSVSCPSDHLPPGEKMICKSTAAVEEGPNENHYSITARAVFGGVLLEEPFEHSGDAYYQGVAPGIEVESLVEGQDADRPEEASSFDFNRVVSWQYVVKNTGGLDLSDIVVSDTEELDVSCPKASLAPGTKMTCHAQGTVLIGGLHNNVATATAKAPSCPVVSASDPTYYETVGGDCGFPAVDIEMATEDKDAEAKDADTPTGPILIAGSTVHWTYEVANNCPFTLTDVSVTDKHGGTVCEQDSLPAGGRMTCTASGVAVAGQYAGGASVTAKPPAGEVPFTDSDPSHYFGQKASIAIEVTADDATFDIGETIDWKFQVTNTGNVDLASVTVAAGPGVQVDCPPSTLVVGGAPRTCTGTNVALEGQHQISATATGQPPVGPPVSASGSGSYEGRIPPPPPPSVVPDRMTGGGGVGQGSDSFSHGFELRCGGRGSNNLEINWGKGNGKKSEKFHLSSLNSATCSDDPSISEGSPVAGFDTIKGSGTGSLNGEPGAKVSFRLSDAGEPSTSDWAEFRITPPEGGAPIVLSGRLRSSNHQAHGK